MALVMGVFTIVRLGGTAPRKIFHSVVRSSGKFHQKLPATTVSADEFSCALKRLGDLEGKVAVLGMKPTKMPPEKEEMLNSAVKRVDALEVELAETKKVTIW